MSLAGSGTAPVASASPSSLMFSSQSVGTRSVSQPVMVSNTGTATLFFSSIVATANFGETNDCGSSLAVNDSCTINVTFAPSTAGSLSGSLIITDNSNGVAASAQTVSLKGTGAISTQTAIPIFYVPSGTYASAQLVTISDPTPGAAIYYTTNGTTPTTASTVYSGAITVNSSENLEAMAVATGYSASPVATAVYTIGSTTTFTTLVSFNGTDGANTSRALIQGLDGNLYGTTTGGGANDACNGQGCGTVFKITPSGTLTTLYNFCSQTGCADGSLPYAGLDLGTDGNLFGTTYEGGTNTTGTVFEITPAGTLTTLHSFEGSDGEGPLAALVQATDGNFYGTAAEGGKGYGTIFKITAGGTLTTLYSFCFVSPCTDGYSPQGGVIQAADGNFYGTTLYGEYSQAIGACPFGCGTVFKITPTGTLTTLHTFDSTDGANPYGGLVQATDGNLYGTTTYGGANQYCAFAGPIGCGTVFKITPSGTFSTLYSFCVQSGCQDGSEPAGGLVQGTDANLYGTTSSGGANGTGTVFRITPGGVLTTLHSFDGTDVESPYAGLFQATNGYLYGTTLGGGANGDGTAFSLAAGLGPFVESVPTSAIEGAAVLILGNNLTGATAVSFNGTPATFTVVSDTEIETTVPIGATTGTIQVTTATGTLNSNVAFQVTGPQPAALVAPGGLTFTGQTIGTTSASQQVTVTNTGGANLTISSIVPSANFSETDSCGSILAVGGDCTINVTFSPTAPGPLTGSLTITDNSNGVAGSTQTISLAGTGIPLLTITASSASMTYGGAVPAINANYSGFINGDSSASLTTQPTCTTIVTSSSPVGSYPTTCTGAVDSNYTINYVQGTVTVGPAPLTITASSGSFTYGGTVPAIMPSYMGFANGDTAASLSTQPTCATTATSGSPVSGSPYPSSCAGAVNSNYTFHYVNGSVTENPASLTITASSGSFTYGGTVPSITPSYVGFVNGDTPASLTTPPTCSTTATNGSPVSGSPYPSSCAGAVDSNYTIHYVNGSVTENPASLTITASTGSFTYGTAPTVTPIYMGFVNGDTAASLTTPPTCSTTATSASPVSGSPYPTSCTGAVDSNYTIHYVNGSLTENPAALTITASSGSFTYGGTVPTITPIYSGFVNGNTAASLTTQPTCSTTATSASPVSGSPYPSSCAGAVDSNYTIHYVNGSVTENPVSLTITASSGSFTYGGTVPTITPSYLGFVNGDTAASLTTPPTCSTTATSGSAVSGSPYPSSCTGAVDSNYTIHYVNGSVTENPASLTITASTGSFTYGTAPTVTPIYMGFVNGDTAVSLTTPPTCSTTATSASPVSGSPYPTSCTGAVDSNYTIHYVNGSLTENPASLTITARSGSFNYGGIVPTIAPIYSGFVNGDTAASLTTAPTCSTTASSGSPVSGSPYPTSCMGAVDGNYTIHYVNGSITENPSALTITASSGSFTYGGTVPTITPSYSGFVNGDTSASLTTPPTCSTTATSHSPAGSYPSSCSGAVDSNYTISYVSGTVTDSAVPLTITASSGTMTYGGTPPTITPGYSGFVNGDTAASLTTPPTCSTTATSHSPVGSYPSSCSGAVDSNYTISYVNGTVTDGAAPLTITASSGTMTYGGTPPTITPSYSGFANGDTAASLTVQPTCSTTATSSTPVGTDTGADTCSGAVDANYSFTYVAGNMTVNQATPIITWATAVAITYGTTLSSTQLDATASVPGTFVYSPAAGTTPAAGTDTLSVTFTPTNATDYTTAAQTVSLTVSKATPTITWATPAGITYGTALSSTQLDATASVPGTFVYSPAAGTTPAGGTDTLSVTFTPTDTTDYNTATATVTLAVADFTFTAPSGSSTSATVAPGQTATYTLSVGGEGGLSGMVSFTVTGAPSEATCAVSPNPAALGTNVTVTCSTTASSADLPRSRPLPPVPPLSPGLRGLLMVALVLMALAWAIMRRNQPDVNRWKATMLPLAAGLLLILALAGCGGGGGGGGGSTTPSNPGTPAGTYMLTVTGTAGAGSSAVSNSVTLTLIVS